METSYIEKDFYDSYKRKKRGGIYISITVYNIDPGRADDAAPCYIRWMFLFLWKDFA
jgi:hypothetical protein